MHQAMPSAVLHTSAGPRQCFVSEPSFRNSAWRGDYHGGATTCSAHSTTRLPADISVTRRQLCISTGQMVAGALLLARPATAADDAAKMRHLSTEALRDIIVEDFQDRQYYTTGQLTQAIFDDQCAFIDPTTVVKGPKFYSKAVAALFDASSSRADLISAQVVDDKTIELRWRFDAATNLPGKPRLKPYTGSTKYIINNEGLVEKQIETWDISVLDAFISTFFKGFGAPPAPPVSRTS